MLNYIKNLFLFGEEAAAAEDSVAPKNREEYIYGKI